MFERYTESARRTFFFARHSAAELGGTAIEAEHVLLGLIRDVKRSNEPDSRTVAVVPRKHPQGNRSTDRLPGEGLDIDRTALQRRNQVRAAVGGGRGRPGPYEIVSLVGAGGWAKSTKRGTPGSIAPSPSRFCRQRPPCELDARVQHHRTTLWLVESNVGPDGRHF